MAGEALALISAIYRIEDEIDGQPTAERLIARRTWSRAAVDGFWDWCVRMLEEEALTSRHPIRKAIVYAVERRATLEAFLADPNVPPNANRIENKLRPVKLGRRNRLFACDVERIAMLSRVVPAPLRQAKEPESVNITVCLSLHLTELEGEQT